MKTRHWKPIAYYCMTLLKTSLSGMQQGYLEAHNMLLRKQDSLLHNKAMMRNIGFRESKTQGCITDGNYSLVAFTCITVFV